MNSELKRIKIELESKRAPHSVNVRTFLDWFGYRRRRQSAVIEIRAQLEEAKIETVPDFEQVWLDESISFKIIEPAKDRVHSDSVGIGSKNWVPREAAFSIGRLQAAAKGIVSVNPTTPVSEATTIMLARGFSQLPVMTNDREVKGIISWKSIGLKRSLGATISIAQDAMEKVDIFDINDSIFTALPRIVDSDCVLIKGADRKITGIITASDLSVQFHELTEPFLLLSEIENHVRNLIGKSFDLEHLLTIFPDNNRGTSKKTKSLIDKLNFGEYINLLENPIHWEKFSKNLDRGRFCESLELVRETRNDVMHFDPDGIEDDRKEKLRQFAKFLTSIADFTSL